MPNSLRKRMARRRSCEVKRKEPDDTDDDANDGTVQIKVLSTTNVFTTTSILSET
jgi:hypothetical protein